MLTLQRKIIKGNMIPFRGVCIVLLLIVKHENVVKAQKVQRIEKRIRILEDKVHLELSDLHEDLEAVVKLVNETVINMNTNGQSFGKYGENISEKNLAKLVSQLTELKEVIVDKTKAVWIGFSKEKSILRRHARDVDDKVHCLNRSISKWVNKMDDKLEGITFKLDQGITAFECNDDEIRDKLASLSGAMHELEKAVDELEISNQGIEDTIDNHDETLTTASNAIKRLTSRISSLEVMITLVPVRTSLMIQLKLTHRDITSYGSSLYFVSRDKQTWADAKTKCESYGAYLVEIDNDGELQHVKSILKINNSRFGPLFWLGGNDIDDEGTWMWSGSKTLLTVTNWNSKEPNGKTSENCLQAYGYNGRWNDRRCSYAMPALCEISA